MTKKLQYYPLYALLCFALLAGCGSENVQYQNLADENADAEIFEKDVQAAPICTRTNGNCKDGIDNDCDGLTDYPADPDCKTVSSNESPSPNSPQQDPVYALAWDAFHTKRDKSQITSGKKFYELPSAYKNIPIMHRSLVGAIGDSGFYYDEDQYSMLTPSQVVRSPHALDMEYLVNEASRELNQMPMGHKAIFDFGVYNILNTEYDYVDKCKNPDGSPINLPCIWWQKQIDHFSSKYNDFFSKLKSESITVDNFVLDVEDTFRAPINPGEKYISDSHWDAIFTDPRFTQRTPVGTSLVGPIESLLRSFGDICKNYGGTGYRSKYYLKTNYIDEQTALDTDEINIWNNLAANLTAQYKNETINVAGIKQSHPLIKIANYRNYYSSPKYPVPHLGTPKGSFYSDPTKTYHVGTRQALVFYGITVGLVQCNDSDNSLCFYKDNAARKEHFINDWDDLTAFKSLKFDINVLRSAKLSRPDVPIDAWISHKSWCDSGYTKYITSNGKECTDSHIALYQDEHLYEEMIFHAALNGVEDFLYWNPHLPQLRHCSAIWDSYFGDDGKPRDDISKINWDKDCQEDWTYTPPYTENNGKVRECGYDENQGQSIVYCKNFSAKHSDDVLIDSLLSEFNKIAGFSAKKELLTELVTDDNKNSNITGIKCFTNTKNKIVCPFDWEAKYLLSGMEAGGRKVWRLTPDPASVADGTFSKENNTPAMFKINGKTLIFPDGIIVNLAGSPAAAGYWIVQPAGARYPYFRMPIIPIFIRNRFQLLNIPQTLLNEDVLFKNFQSEPPKDLAWLSKNLDIYYPPSPANIVEWFKFPANATVETKMNTYIKAFSTTATVVRNAIKNKVAVNNKTFTTYLSKTFSADLTTALKKELTNSNTTNIASQMKTILSGLMTNGFDISK